MEENTAKKDSSVNSLFKHSMELLALAYLIGALFFFFIPDGVNYILNFLPIFFKILQPLPEKNTDFFWLPLVASLMFVLAYIAYKSSRDPDNKTLINIHITSKFISSIGYLYLFFSHAFIFGYLVGGILDLVICAYVLFLKFKLQKLAKEEAPQPNL
ncbi:MAG TPA: hypothetical protein PLX23_00295 [Candidatus Hydrogenedens sp.]|nr:hypothetical protein [Candidatus Hydrogenedens sp.]